MTKRRFKIDLSNSHCYIFGLFIERRRWFWMTWDRIETFDTYDKAREYYDKIKDLPKYL